LRFPQLFFLANRGFVKRTQVRDAVLLLIAPPYVRAVPPGEADMAGFMLTVQLPHAMVAHDWLAHEKTRHDLEQPS
jgi:hypothetical protein